MMATVPVSNENPFRLDEGEKFACIGLHVSFLTATLPKVVDSGTSVYGNLGQWISDHWKEWLGSFHLEVLQEADLFIVAHAPSEKPDIPDAEHDNLMLGAGLLFSGLLLTDIRFRSRPTHVKGSYYKGKTQIHKFEQGCGYLCGENHPYTILNDARFQRAVDVRNGLLSLSGRPNEFLRFRRGLGSVYHALKGVVVDERVFYFTRALEALHASKKGEGRKDFITRCTKITGGTARCHELFGDLYDTRNNFVHANEFDQLLKAGETLASVDARLGLQAIDAQLLVLETYRTILCDSALLEQFKDDSSSQSHWASDWTPPITVEAIRSQRETDVQARHRTS